MGVFALARSARTVFFTALWVLEGNSFTRCNVCHITVIIDLNGLCGPIGKSGISGRPAAVRGVCADFDPFPAIPGPSAVSAPTRRRIYCYYLLLLLGGYRPTSKHGPVSRR